VPVFEGQSGVHNGQYAIKVERMLGPPESDAPTIPGVQNG
jgi:flagellar motor switch protein FliM